MAAGETQRSQSTARRPFGSLTVSDIPCAWGSAHRRALLRSLGGYSLWCPCTGHVRVRRGRCGIALLQVLTERWPPCQTWCCSCSWSAVRNVELCYVPICVGACAHCDIYRFHKSSSLLLQAAFSLFASLACFALHPTCAGTSQGSCQQGRSQLDWRQQAITYATTGNAIGCRILNL